MVEESLYRRPASALAEQSSPLAQDDPTTDHSHVVLTIDPSSHDKLGGKHQAHEPEGNASAVSSRSLGARRNTNPYANGEPLATMWIVHLGVSMHEGSGRGAARLRVAVGAHVVSAVGGAGQRGRGCGGDGSGRWAWGAAT